MLARSCVNKSDPCLQHRRCACDTRVATRLGRFGASRFEIKVHAACNKSILLESLYRPHSQRTVSCPSLACRKRGVMTFADLWEHHGGALSLFTQNGPLYHDLGKQCRTSAGGLLKVLRLMIARRTSHPLGRSDCCVKDWNADGFGGLPIQTHLVAGVALEHLHPQRVLAQGKDPLLPSLHAVDDGLIGDLCALRSPGCCRSRRSCRASPGCAG